MSIGIQSCKRTKCTIASPTVVVGDAAVAVATIIHIHILVFVAIDVTFFCIVIIRKMMIMSRMLVTIWIFVKGSHLIK